MLGYMGVDLICRFDHHSAAGESACILCPIILSAMQYNAMVDETYIIYISTLHSNPISREIPMLDAVHSPAAAALSMLPC
jgi:hypothetical protein